MEINPKPTICKLVIISLCIVFICSNVIQHFVGDCDSDVSGETDNILVEQLKAASKVAKRNNNPFLAETILMSTGQIAR